MVTIEGKKGEKKKSIKTMKEITKATLNKMVLGSYTQKYELIEIKFEKHRSYVP